MNLFLQMKKDIGRLNVLENKFRNQKFKLDKKEMEVRNLLDQYEKEKRDVLNMQEESLSLFLLRITGRFDKKMKKEMQEEIDAKMKFDAAKTDLELIREEYKTLISEILELKKVSNEYEMKVKAVRDELINSQDEKGNLFRILENQISIISRQLTEISKALSAAKKVVETSRSALESLQKAESWATYEVWMKGGIISHAAKYSHVDEAQSKFNVLSSQIKNLKSELSDVDGFLNENLSEISSSQRTVDFWFDNIFTNLSVRSKIRDNMDTLREIMGKVRNIESKLLERQKSIEREMETKESEQEEIIYSVAAQKLQM